MRFPLAGPVTVVHSNDATGEALRIGEKTFGSINFTNLQINWEAIDALLRPFEIVSPVYEFKPSPYIWYLAMLARFGRPRRE